MSNWPGNLIRKTPVTPAGPLQNGAAPGIWSLAEASYWTKQGLWPTAGNFLAVEDVFSTWLYTGTGSTQTITNGINLSGQGGLVWFKCRTSGIFSHQLYDTVRGATIQIGTNSTSGNSTNATGLTAFTSSGFTIGSLSGVNSGNMASWTFREAPKFFDVVTYTGNGVTGRAITHNLGVSPGCVMIKRTDSTGDWTTWHRSLSGSYPSSQNYLFLNTTDAQTTAVQPFTVAPSATQLTVSASISANSSGATYVAYLFAHDTASDGIIQCGTATCSGGVANISLGWEPQWILAKQTNTTGDWRMIDNMRGWTNNSGGNQTGLQANTSAAEATYGWGDTLSATGCNLYGGTSDTFIYIAIRRGPMRTPTLGTSVFSLTARTGNGTATNITSPGFVTDLVIAGNRTGGSQYAQAFLDRLRGTNLVLGTSETTAETTISNSITGFDTNTGYNLGAEATTAGEAVINRNTTSFVNYALRRAPNFFDEVCYTGNGANRTLNHNLGAVPELMIVKARGVSFGWAVYAAASGAGNFGRLDLSNAFAAGATAWNNTAPTSTVFSVGTSTLTNPNTYACVAYLFASCPGVSKVGSYTGTGALQTINCGFSSGARFVMIKRTDSTGGWYFWDSTRGLSSGNDPYLLFDTSSAEVTGTNYVDTDTTGFKVTAAAPADLNAVGGTYTFLAIS